MVPLNGCDLAPLNEKSLLKHALGHPEWKPFKCTTCSKVYALEKSLKTHKHGHTCTSKCTTPCKAFSRKKSHECGPSAEKPFKCTICCKAFALSEKLETHLSVHREGKPYKCKFCSKEFVKLNTLKSHLKTHKDKYPVHSVISNSTRRFI